MDHRSFWTDLLGAAVSYYDAKGMRTRCIEAGTGASLIFLHGSGGHAEAFSRNVVPLSEHFHVYAIDMAGHGYTDRHPTLSGIEGIADHVLRFMDAAGIDRAHLGGESLGGATAAKLALEHADRVNKVVYITGAGLVMGEEADRLAAPGRESFQRLSAAATQNPTHQTIRDRLAWLFADPETAVTDELVEVRYRIYVRRAAESAGAAAGPPGSGGGVGVSLTPERLRQIKAPFFFLWTDHNPSTPWAGCRDGAQADARIPVPRRQACWPLAAIRAAG